MQTIIDSHNFEEGKGLPMGNQSSQCFALLYLDSLDRFFKEKMGIKYYLRYMDDMIILVENRTLAKECLFVAGQMLKNMKLIINPKSQIFPVKNGLEFLGWRFSFNKQGKIVQKLRKNTKKRIIAKLKDLKFQKFYKKITFERIFNSLISYNGFLHRGNAFKFHVFVKKFALKNSSLKVA